MDKNNNQTAPKGSLHVTDRMVEVVSKTQKIITALYLVSDLISEDDPLRKDIRNVSVELGSLVHSIGIQSPSQAKKTITEAENYIDRLLDLLKVCVSVGFVSDMNFKVISEYLVVVRDGLNQAYGLINSQSLLASSFHNKAIHEFVLPDAVTKENTKEIVLSNRPTPHVPKEQVFKKTTEPVKDNTYKGHNQNNKGQDINNGRTEKLLGIIRQKGEVSVGDVSQEFPELSEKTVQRMLIGLLNQGKLQKTGEKRWSRYSLVA